MLLMKLIFILIIIEWQHIPLISQIPRLECLLYITKLRRLIFTVMKIGFGIITKLLLQATFRGTL